MKRAVTVILVIAFVLVLTVLFAVYRRPILASKAVYQGRTAQEWLDEYSTNAANTSAAIQAMGSNAVPDVIEALRDENSAMTTFYRTFYSKLPAGLKRHLTPPRTSPAPWYPAEILLPTLPNLRPFLPELMDVAAGKDHHPRFAVLSATYQLFDTNDTKYVPTLIQLLGDTNTIVRLQATWCLAKIGPSAKAAVPALKTAMNDSSLDVRICAAWTIWGIDRQTNFISAALKEDLKSSEISPYNYKDLIPGELAVINPADPVIIPAYIDMLNSPDDRKRTFAAAGLWRYGPEAAAAVPGLTNAIETGSPFLRQQALRTLQRIDPSTAANYGTNTQNISPVMAPVPPPPRLRTPKMPPIAPQTPTNH